MRFGTWTILCLVLTCGLASQAATQERRLKRADLPAAVQKTADQESEGARVRGYSSEKNGDQLEYEVAMTVRGHNRDVTISADGSVVEVEERSRSTRCPPPYGRGCCSSPVPARSSTSSR